MQDRRNDSRLLCAELVELKFRDRAGNEQMKIVNLEDISLQGACVQLETDIPQRAAVTIFFGGGKLAGTVRYCVFRDSSYFIGIEFEETSRWSLARFCPEHLVDPRDLVQNALDLYEVRANARLN